MKHFSLTRSTVRKGIPVLTLLLGVVIDGMRGCYFLPISPFIVLTLIYYWTIYRPDLLPAWSLFAVGILQDIMGGCFLGQTTFLYLLLYGSVLLQRRYLINYSFNTIWGIFLGCCFSLAIIEWGCACILRGHLFALFPSLGTHCLSGFLYPWIHLELMLLRKNKIFRV